MRGIYQSVLHAIGDTPLVQLNKVVGRHDARVLAKLEYMNPGGSIKDRMALHILEKAEREGLLKPGAVIVENTSGNTGVGVAMAAALKVALVLRVVSRTCWAERASPRLERRLASRFCWMPTGP